LKIVQKLQNIFDSEAAACYAAGKILSQKQLLRQQALLYMPWRLGHSNKDQKQSYLALPHIFTGNFAMTP
jgi:hypothetical protein